MYLIQHFLRILRLWRKQRSYSEIYLRRIKGASNVHFVLSWMGSICKIPVPSYGQISFFSKVTAADVWYSYEDVFCAKLGVSPEQIFTVSIMPCLAKKGEQEMELFHGEYAGKDIDVYLRQENL